MSGDRYEIERSGDAVLIDGEHCWAVDGDTAELAVGQLLSDIDQLRADLAAAVAERDRLARSIEDDFSGWRAVEQRWRIRAEQAEARLATIRAALERGLEVLPTYAKTYAQLAEALAALAELERAHGACADLRAWFDQACEDIARMHDELAQLRGDATKLRDDLREPAEREGGSFAHFYGRVQRMLLAHPPPAPVAEMREPTPEECERICTEYERLLMREGTCGGRDAFDAVRAVMWPKEGL